MATDAWGFSVVAQATAQRYRNVRLTLSAARLAVFLGVVAWLLSGPTIALRNAVSSLTASPWLIVAGYVLVVYGLLWVVGLPFAILSALVVEKRFGLSTASAAVWLRDEAKATLFGLAFAVIGASVLYTLIRWSPTWWWLAAWAIGFAFQIAIGVVGPIVIAPLFYRFTPLRDEAIARRLRSLAEANGVAVVGAFEMKASAKTRRSNAALAGFGRTRRIIVTDTLLESFTPDEVETVLAHELAHQRNGDSWRGLALSAVVSFLGFGVVGLVFPPAAAALGFVSIADVAALPLLMVLGGAVSIPLAPVEHALTRRWEGRADAFALEATGKRDAFASAMVKLHDRNLAIANPHWLLERMFYSHPSGRRRVERAREVPASKPY